MALPGVPAIKLLSDSANYAVTAQPYLAQLPTFPSKVVEAVLTSKAAAINLYVDTNPLLTAFAFSLLIGAIVLVVAEFNRNYSQVDRLWSILPTVYIWHYNIWARQSGVPHARLDLAVFWATLWTSRLTFNYWRKGGYNIGSEDYRWAIIAKQIGPVAMFALDATFISFIQSVGCFVACALRW
jgi:steroid 5-alpha reductase family enzyme